jgi:S1-C subfamily serine protease
MTALDVGAIVLVVLAASVGYRKGLVATASAVAGILFGAWFCSLIARDFVSGHHASVYWAVAVLVGAVLGALVLETLARIGGFSLRTGVGNVLLTVNSAGGLMLGAVTGIVAIWVLGGVALLMRDEPSLRREAQRSGVLRRLDGIVAPRTLLGQVSQIDQVAAAYQPTNVAPPDPRLVRMAAVRAARRSVVRLLVQGCGIHEGSGWVAAPGLVVTAAHTIAGGGSIIVELASGRQLPGEPVALGRQNDIAVLRVAGLDVRPLRTRNPSFELPVGVLGYPLNGPYSATPARLARTQWRRSRDESGSHRGFRTAMRGSVLPGDSGGPVVDGSGRVAATIVEALVGTEGGFGVPSRIVRRIVRIAEHNGRVSPSPCPLPKTG